MPLFPNPVGKDRKRSDSVQERTESSRGTQMVKGRAPFPFLDISFHAFFKVRFFLYR